MFYVRHVTRVKGWSEGCRSLVGRLSVSSNWRWLKFGFLYQYHLGFFENCVAFRGVIINIYKSPESVRWRQAPRIREATSLWQIINPWQNIFGAIATLDFDQPFRVHTCTLVFVGSPRGQFWKISGDHLRQSLNSYLVRKFAVTRHGVQLFPVGAGSVFNRRFECMC